MNEEVITTDKNPIQVADRLFLAMETLASEGSLGLTELSQKLELNKSTAHRVLNSLIYMGYVKQDEITSKYRLSYKICKLSNQVLSQADILETTRPHLKRLVSEIGETIHFVQRDNAQAIYIDKVESYSNSIRMASKVGYTIPLYCSGVGKALLADMDDDKVKKIWKDSKIKSMTEYTIVDFEKFVEELELTRSRGYALDNEENELGVRCIAVSIRSHDNSQGYALSISAPIDRMSDSRIEELSRSVLSLKQELENAL